MKLKILLTIGLSLFFMNLSFGQVNKFKSNQFSLKWKLGSNWSAWSTPEKRDVLIVMNVNAKNIKIYPNDSDTTIIYDVVNVEGKSTNSNGDSILTFVCVDNDGDDCVVRLVGLKDSKKVLLEIEFKDMGILYNIYPINLD